MLAKEACIKEPDNVDALMMRALMAERCNDRPLALDSVLQAYKIAPENFAVLYTLGRLYSESNSTAAEAMGYLEKANKIQPDDVNTLKLLANVCVTLKSEKALVYLKQLESLDSGIINSFEGKTMFGHAYAIRKANREATGSFGMADKLGRNILSNYNFAVAVDCLYNQPDIALEKYQRFLKQTASNSEYARLRKDVEKRINKIKKTRRRR